MNFTSIFRSTQGRKVPLINNISVLMICLVLITYTYPGFQATSFADWRDPAVIGLGIVGGGLAIGGAIATAPAWGIAGGVCAIVAGGIALWDWADGPDEDSCNDCDGSGYYNGDNCNTCNPPDDDGCPNCPGTGCSSCAQTCSICGETFYSSHTCESGYDYTPGCSYCTAGCSSCSVGSSSSSGSYYSY